MKIQPDCLIGLNCGSSLAKQNASVLTVKASVSCMGRDFSYGTAPAQAVSPTQRVKERVSGVSAPSVKV